MPDFIDKHHIVRRLLIVIYSFFLLKITYRLLCEGIPINAFNTTVYVSFAGIITFMLKFYFDSRNIEIKGKIEEDKRNNNN